MRSEESPTGPPDIPSFRSTPAESFVVSNFCVSGETAWQGRAPNRFDGAHKHSSSGTVPWVRQTAGSSESRYTEDAPSEASLPIWPEIRAPGRALSPAARNDLKMAVK